MKDNETSGMFSEDKHEYKDKSSARQQAEENPQTTEDIDKEKEDDSRSKS